MIHKRQKKEISAILNDKETWAIAVFSKTGDQDKSYVTNEDGVDASWDMVRVMMNMLVNEFDSERSSQLLTKFLRTLGYFITKEEAEGAYERFCSPVKDAN